MKLKRHDKRPEKNYITLKFEPMSVWLSEHTELIIELGDTVGEIAEMIRKQSGWKIDEIQSMKLAAYWFSVGERHRDGRFGQRWTNADLDYQSRRRYLKRRPGSTKA